MHDHPQKKLHKYFVRYNKGVLDRHTYRRVNKLEDQVLFLLSSVPRRQIELRPPADCEQDAVMTERMSKYFHRHTEAFSHVRCTYRKHTN